MYFVNLKIFCFTYHNVQVYATYLQVQTSKLPCNHYLTNIPILHQYLNQYFYKGFTKLYVKKEKQYIKED